MGGDRARSHYQGPGRDPSPARDANSVLTPHRTPAAASISASGSRRVRGRGPPVVSRGIASRPRIPALRLRARDLRARNDEALPPNRPVLVLSADCSGRRFSLDRARARRSEELALGLAGPAREPAGAGVGFPGLLGSRTLAVLHTESVEAAAIRVALDAGLRPRGRSAADAPGERAGRRNRSGKAHLRGDRRAARSRARVS